MRILSLFDGMSGGMLALKRAWIQVDTYMVAEIDKYAIQISKKNFPEIIQLWDINNRRERDIWEIDMIIGWSPCQWFSYTGKQLAFDDPRSKLFFVMVDIINHYKPKYFLLENVKMKKEFQDVITDYMWVSPIEINSSLVSAQNRARLYWTNIPWVEKPKDIWVHLSDILENDTDWIWEMPKSVKCNVVSQIEKIRRSQKDIQVLECSSRQQDNRVGINKSPCLRASNSLCLWRTKSLWVRKISISEKELLQTLPVWYTEWISDSQRSKLIWNGWTIDVISHIFSFLK